MSVRIEKSFCRTCFGACGVDVTIGEDGRIQSVRGDHENPVTQGYACIKGLEAPYGFYSERRILEPLKRVDGKLVPIPLEQALDEIAEKMMAISSEEGAQSLAFLRGTGIMGKAILTFTWSDLANAVGGQFYSTMTIDQSAKWVTMERLGTWPAGKQPMVGSDVWLVSGSNPLVSIFSWELSSNNFVKQLKKEREAGMKLIVIDPRKSELTKFADIHLQIYPGEDAAVAAGFIHVILANGWEDKAFCAANVKGMDALREAVAPFTPEVVAARAGISAGDLIAAARLFAHESRRGSLGTGTGVGMSRFPNLAEHLYEVIGVICGRFLREGEKLPNPGVIVAKQPPHAEAVSPARSFEMLPRSRVRGAVRLMGESATPTIAEDILTPGQGRLRALLVSAANPASAIPDSHRVVEALRALDLLVVVDPYETETTQLAHYVLPPQMFYEHADITFALEMISLDQPYVQYTPALVEPPAGSKVTSEGYIVWSLAKRMGLTYKYFGVDLDMETPPTDDTFLSILTRHSSIPYERLKTEALGGKVYDELPAVHVLPPSGNGGRFEVMPEDVASEAHAFAATPGAAEEMAQSKEFPLRLTSRRVREVLNTAGRDYPSARKRLPYNPLWAHPDDLARLGIPEGGECWVMSDNGRIPAIAEADATMKPGVVSMTHGYGGLAGKQTDYRQSGASTSLLVSLDRDYEPLQGMPRMSGIPVRVEFRQVVDA